MKTVRAAQFFDNIEADRCKRNKPFVCNTDHTDFHVGDRRLFFKLGKNIDGILKARQRYGRGNRYAEHRSRCFQCAERFKIKRNVFAVRLKLRQNPRRNQVVAICIRHTGVGSVILVKDENTHPVVAGILTLGFHRPDRVGADG